MSQIAKRLPKPLIGDDVNHLMSRFFLGVAFAALVIVAALRPLISETYDSAPSSISLADRNISDPQPIRTLTIDIVILTAAVVWAVVSAATNVRAYRWTGLELGLALIACASVISCAVAGNKRLAINASVDWLCSAALGLVFVQLIRAPWQRSLLLGAMLASATVQVTQCIDQRVSMEETWKQYQENKSEFWRRQGIDPESNHAALFEARMRAGQASGFLPHSNVTGAYFAMCGLAAMGAALGGWRSVLPQREHEGRSVKRSPSSMTQGLRPSPLGLRPSPLPLSLRGRGVDAPNGRGVNAPGLRLTYAVGAAALAAFLLVGIFLTKSRGAGVSLVAGLMTWIGVRLGRRWIDAHRHKALLAGWIAFIVIIGAVVGHGIYHGTLPTDSLAFRWQYWRNSTGMIADHWLTGVGRENFGGHYLLHKPIESPEEISNPHDVFVQAAAEWGVLGVLGVAALFVGASCAFATRRGTAPPGVSHVASGASAPASLSKDRSAAPRGRRGRFFSATHKGRRYLFWGVAMLIALTVIRIPLLGTKDANYLYYMSALAAMAWLPAFLLVTLGTSREEIAERTGREFAGVAFGLFAFVLQELINFALFVPATATTAFALYACAIANSEGDPGNPLPEDIQGKGSSAGRWFPACLTIVAIIGVLWLGVIPVFRAGRFLTEARGLTAFRPSESPASSAADVEYKKAAAVDPLDATPLVELAKWLGSVADTSPNPNETLSRAIENVRTGQRRDPSSHSLRRLETLLCRDLARRTGDVEDYRAAIRAADEMLKLYPLDPSGLVLRGEIQLKTAKITGSDPLGAEGVKSLQEALDLDARRPPWSVFQGLTESERVRVAKEIADSHS